MPGREGNAPRSARGRGYGVPWTGRIIGRMPRIATWGNLGAILWSWDRRTRVWMDWTATRCRDDEGEGMEGTFKAPPDVRARSESGRIPI